METARRFGNLSKCLKSRGGLQSKKPLQDMSNNQSTAAFHSSTKTTAEAEKGNPLKSPISFFRRIHDRTPTEETTIIAFILRVRLGSYGETIKQIREFEEQGDHQRADEIKRTLPSVTLSGLVTEGLRAGAHKEGRFQHSGYLQGDFDAKDFHPRAADEIKEMLAGDEHVQSVFLSVKFGVKAIIRIPVCATQSEHTAAFTAAESYFREKYGLKLDASTKDPARLCFVSFDPEAYLMTSPATVLPVTSAKNSRGASMTPGECSILESQDAKGNAASAKHDPLTPETIKGMLTCIPTRPDYDTWLKVSSAVWSATGDEAAGTALLKEWSPEEEPGEYSEKFKTRLTEITAGTLVHLARKHGYQFPSAKSNCDSVDVPEGVFPVPAGEIEYREAGEIIFSTIAPKHRLFIRGGTVHEIKGGGKGHDHFEQLFPERFCSLLENFGHRVARREWQEGGGGGKGKHIWRSRRMPISAAKILLCSDSATSNLPPVRQLAACPVLSKDGEVLGRGYHPHAGGTYVTDGEIPPEMPVEAATAAILGLLDDFNFVTPADKSRAVASFLSPALKMGNWIDDDFPLDVGEATESQSGKTYRQKLVNRTYNEIPSAIPAPRGGVGSLDEAISTALIKGRPFVTLDNFRGKLDSTILEQAVRGVGRVTCRALRVSADVDTGPFNWQLSTNGAEFTRDIANRSIITRIRKQSSGYQFKEYAEGSLEAHVEAQQAFYLGAVFSVIKEWSQNGCPKTDDSRHDFRGWCRSLDWIVQNIFKLAPLLDGHSEEQARTANPALQWLREVTIAARDGKQLQMALTTAQLVSIAEDAGIEFPGNPLGREEPHQRAGKILGRLFRDTEGQPVTVDGLTVARVERDVYVEGRGHEKQKFYSIVPVA
ncbi:PriCT-2 domain-containing protein [Akkermansiaceae bacterium]|nr:PriCT-2 domain-containing protein [Akkermansiaceae bacterium]